MPEEFYSKVAGVAQRNDDGSDRQTIIKRCAAGEPLHLVPEPHNAHSKHAVRVVRANGQQLGYLPDETARGVTRHLKAGGVARATINEVTGGTRDKPTRGVNLIVHQDDGETRGRGQLDEIASAVSARRPAARVGGTTNGPGEKTFESPMMTIGSYGGRPPCGRKS